MKSLVYLCLVYLSSNVVVNVKCQDSCEAPVTLLVGRRSIPEPLLTASSQRDDGVFGTWLATEARLNDDGWCSDDQPEANNNFPYLQVDFRTDVLFHSIQTEGFLAYLRSVFVEEYRVSVAGKDGQFHFINSSTNPSQPADFPLSGSIEDRQISEQLLNPNVCGQMLRLIPTQWTDRSANDQHACTRLEVRGCPLLECKSTSERVLTGLNTVTSVTVDNTQLSSSDIEDLFADDGSAEYCAPTNRQRPVITISFSSFVVIVEIGINGDATLFFPDYVTNFTVSYFDGQDVIAYTGLRTFTPSSADKQYFGLWPPINTSSITITIESFNNAPCLNLLLRGCHSDNGVHHSKNPINGVPTTVQPTVVRPMTTTAGTSTASNNRDITTTVQSTTKSSINPTTTAAFTETSNPTRTNTVANAVNTSSDGSDGVPIFIPIAVVVGVIFLVAGVVSLLGIIWWQRGNLSVLKH